MEMGVVLRDGHPLPLFRDLAGASAQLFFGGLRRSPHGPALAAGRSLPYPQWRAFAFDLRRSSGSGLTLRRAS